MLPQFMEVIHIYDPISELQSMNPTILKHGHTKNKTKITDKM